MRTLREAALGAVGALALILVPAAAGSEPCLWRVKVPGCAGFEATLAPRLAARAWDAAGNPLAATASGTAQRDVGLLGVKAAAGTVRKDAEGEAPSVVTVEGDTCYLELAPGVTPSAAIRGLIPRHDGKALYARLAAHWAPTWYQDEDDSNASADWIVAVDFDGNFSGTDNWDNAGKLQHAFRGSLLNEAVVYWWVVETETHYFIGYADFHPRDWEDRDSLKTKAAGAYNAVTGNSDQHENDMEGCLLTVRKVAGKPFGVAELLQTQAHNQFWQYSPCADQLRARSGREDVDGPIVDDDGHPTLYVEAKGHGVYGSAKTNYRGAGGQDGQIYRYAATPGAPRGLMAWRVEADRKDVLRPAAVDARGRAPRWLSAGGDAEGRAPVDYSLRSIQPLWSYWKGSAPVPGEADLYVRTSSGRAAFHGQRHKDDSANPPWGWMDDDYAGLGLAGGGVGTFFTDPARMYAWQFDANGLGAVSTKVIGASFER